MAERHFQLEEGILVALPVYRSTKIELGKMVSVNATGYAIEAALTSGTRCMGVCRSTADNSSGSDGDINVEVWTNRALWFDNSSANAVDAADVGDLCYVEDDETVRDYVAAGVNVPAGIVLKVDSTDGVLVYFDVPSADGPVDGDLTVGGVLYANGGISTDDGGDLELSAEAGQDIVETLGDDLGVTKHSWENASAATVASIDSTGDVTCKDIDPSGSITMYTVESITSAAELNLFAALNQNVNIHSWDTAITLGDDAALSSVSVLNASAATVASIDSTGDVTCKDIDPTGDISLDAGKALNVAPTGILVAPYNETTTGGAPTQAEMVAAFGAAADGKTGIMWDDTPGVAYFCFCEATTGWYYVAGTVGA